ncbi:sterigmatocystin biosynthesis monooxygenase stcW [Fusarium tjaetaba]|uniref:Sterigmatocystin biosynthesis monooxygenase stcW n=1 Tax=Fusarium tjaetaba TaxID=1567544 RepID=A0A8H5QX78_9HYPO|nr:sterigmatocystin biosynthesis monooxygenase stcW [Fusarium tjaetaba]KAF5624805.1 sterigmatocystin biosynthesis monooxygenase stcW [Fusarium tjaetaba]
MSTQAHSKPRKLRIIHVGAGASGLMTAYKAERMLQNYELVLYDKNPVIGGTWYENRYPGCACDVPAHIYTYSFEPNAEWSRYYANSAEIYDYFLRFAKKYDLEKYAQLRTTVISATWDEADGKWAVKLSQDGKERMDYCDVLMNGSGVVNKMKWPDVPGRSSYNGTIAHSATWDPKITWEGKRVALIGTGSSSVQMLPELAKGSKSVHVFARNSVWIVPSLGTDLSKANQEGQNSSEQPSTQIYSEKDKDEFRKDPAAHLQYRKGLEATLTRNFPFFLRDSPMSQWATAAIKQDMLKKLESADEELKQKLIPSWPPGCRRITPGNDYLESLVQNHVKVVFEGVARFTPTGLVSSDGKEFDFDLIACATGFDISYTPHFKITGIGGVTMKDEWSENPNIYLGITGPKFPNYFVINGPTGNWGQGCVLPSNEGIKAMEVKELPTTQWNEHLDNWHTKYSVWAGDCRSWYKANRTDGRVYIWPGSMLHLLKTMKTPRFEDFNITYRSDNIWDFLGNGRTQIEELAEEGFDVDLAPFIRDHDVPWSIDDHHTLVGAAGRKHKL